MRWILLGLGYLVGLLTGCAQPNGIWWGNVHGHTQLSDGQGSVAEYLRYARYEAKLDFVIVTDHDFGMGF